MTAQTSTPRSVLITGANPGLGFEAAAPLAEKGYTRIARSLL